MQILQKSPKVIPISTINLPDVKEYSGNSGVPVYEIQKKGCNVIRLELAFLAGRPFENAKLISTSCAYLMREGTKSLNSEQIAEQIDFYGASMSINASTDTINATITCLPKHFDSILSIFQEILCEPMFPEEELQNFIKRRVENLKMDLVKGDVVAYRQLTEELYGTDHPYGYNSSAELYQAVENHTLKKHFDKFIVAQNCHAFIAGDINPHHRLSLDKMLGSLNQGHKAVAPVLDIIHSNGERHQKIHLEGNLSQSSIKIGRKLFNRKHPDYPILTFMSTLLGGYFSSRLISNIREKKGLTYGIYSMLDTLLFDGAFIISTEVANKNVDLCIKEIYKEFDILRNTKVGEGEMRLVKNYLAGNYLNFFDGPFNSLRAIKSLVLSDIPLTELKSLVNISQSITPEQVLDISHKYLDRNDFWEVIVGTSTN